MDNGVGERQSVMQTLQRREWFRGGIHGDAETLASDNLSFDRLVMPRHCDEGIGVAERE